MKFRIRPGFRLFPTPDAMVNYSCHGAKSGVQPVEAGRIVSLTIEQIDTLRSYNKLGALEPVDDVARKIYGDTPELISTVFSSPERHAIPPENRTETA